MKCVKLKARAYMMMTECGGATLQAGDVMVVRADIADRMLLQYRGQLAADGMCEMDRLKHGHYQVGTAAAPAPKKVKKKEKAPVKEKAEDKSMMGKVKAKIKGE